MTWGCNLKHRSQVRASATYERRVAATQCNHLVASALRNADVPFRISRGSPGCAGGPANQRPLMGPFAPSDFREVSRRESLSKGHPRTQQETFFAKSESLHTQSKVTRVCACNRESSYRGITSTPERGGDERTVLPL